MCNKILIKFISFTCVAFLQFSVFSQKSSFKAGVGYRKGILTFANLGIGHEIKINEKTNLLIELNRSIKGYITHVPMYNRQGLTIGDFDAGYVQSYLELPFQIKHFVFNKRNLKTFSINGGGYLGYLLAGKFLKVKSTDFFTGKKSQSDLFNTGFNSEIIKTPKIDYGLNVGCSYKFAKTPIGLDLRYSQGLVGQIQKQFYFYDSKMFTVHPYSGYIYSNLPKTAKKLKPNSNLEFSIFYQF